MIGFSDIKQTANEDPIIKVIGIGGGGGNAINRMITSMNTTTVDFIAANTDLQDLRSSAASFKLQLGSICTKGLGAGAKPKVGREAALENTEQIREFVVGADMIFITAGMGGGTGTGAAPIIAQLAKESDALTVGVVTTPFAFEGKQRRKNAEKGIQELKDHVDTLIVIPNNNLLGLINSKTPMVEAFQLADDVLRQAIQGISDLITNEGIINLDFADVRTVMKNGGKAVMGAGVASGEKRAISAAEKAIKSPLLNDSKITGAKGILVNMVGGNSMSMHEVNEAACFIQEQAHDDATIIWGASINIEQDEEIQITVIATGFDGDETKIADSNESLLKTPTSPSIINTLSVRQEPSPSIAPFNNTNAQSELEASGLPSVTKIDQAPENGETSLKNTQDFEKEEQTEKVYSKQQLSIVSSNSSTDEATSKESEGLSEKDNDSETSTISNEENLVTEDEHSLDPKINGSKVEEPETTFMKENATVFETTGSDPGPPPETSEFLEGKSYISAKSTVDVETSPKYPDWAWRKRNRQDFTSDLDIPTFIRRRAKKLGQDLR